MKERVLVRNAADEGQVKDADFKEKRGQERRQNDMRKILDSREGRRWIWEKLIECNIFKTSFTGNSQTFFLEGRRDVGLSILADVMDANPDAYLLMMHENPKGE